MKQSGKAQEPTQLNQEHSDDAIWVSILEQVGEGVIVADASGQIAFVNEAAKRIHGVAELGVGVENWTETYHLLTMEGGDYPPQELPLARALLKREVVRDALWRIRRPDGSEIIAQGTATPLAREERVSMGAVLVLRDVTALHESAAALRESEDHYRHTVELNAQVPWTAAPDGSILDFNQRWLDLTGLTREQALGGGWAQVPHSDDLPQMAAAWGHSLHTGELYDVEHRIRLRDGTYRWMRSRALPRRDETGLIVRWYGTTEDIEPRKVSELAQEAMVAKQRQFLREMLRGFTEGKLRLCDAASDLPSELTPATEPLELSDTTLRVLRKRAETVAKGLRFPKERWQDLETGIGEAAMNAVRHAVGGQARIYADEKAEVIQVWVRDTGAGIAEDLIHRAVERHWTTGGLGQGFWLMLRTCDRIYLLTGPSGTTVVLEQGRQEPELLWMLLPD